MKHHTRREHISVTKYQLSDGQEDEFPASWALPEPDMMRALELFPPKSKAYAATEGA